ncbi:MULTISPECIES: TetR/AcrR family transcriptional regulator [Streptomyces]|uniref:TetR/AcrR family transcriptional regulator n=1 Tax=Streptomyces venezuelae TaxID=54571 RepID=A0A5P2BCX9_STRVZ|nr:MULTISPECIES: TetR/AcrR family transcriptional regulator [Streptomyces]NEA02900.1 TetR/AcrR family transcriptional regulator [Streptomyces sp. SID10116]MYY84192.1 TetR family transcriptional regulator [Streptomyces sp. SID335]MYZ14169.1 TetR family transcriptional regulator [Streptomyces sp. SID337]NDZ90323.1 TetR/AcrR family transcriptional regulator [Streptomyces sp. SID10115]NEB45693.1 TetR/AcrR family transcriptional regulator [Streptomyces sp. SID339]
MVQNSSALDALGTRDRIVVVAARLIQRQGYVGTGIKQIAKEAGATLGSVYHFFPGGKEAVAVAAIGYSAEEFAELLRAGLAGDDAPGAAIERCAGELAVGLRESGWVDGCPVTAAALETLGTDSEIQRVCAEALRGWERIVEERLLGAGFSVQDAREVATTVIGALEGAEVTAQVARSEEPLRAVGRQLARLVGAYGE